MQIFDFQDFNKRQHTDQNIPVPLVFDSQDHNRPQGTRKNPRRPSIFDYQEHTRSYYTGHGVGKPPIIGSQDYSRSQQTGQGRLNLSQKKTKQCNAGFGKKSSVLSNFNIPQENITPLDRGRKSQSNFNIGNLFLKIRNLRFKD
ncbi:hypothetical protein JTE90_002861 [Oedothorax gibbosus]|uniref:Uncharacterized protein n=1 Tax=Oedothorax gibbosus TaxID=931172 RepID=A0AAV6TUM9_9ARAC|nr:hypothetical protein JTE90_002861 [Oedothorax gibbosus]